MVVVKMEAQHLLLLLVMSTCLVCQGRKLDVERRLDVSTDDVKKREQLLDEIMPYLNDALYAPQAHQGGGGGGGGGGRGPEGGGGFEMNVDVDVGDINLEDVELNLDMGDIDVQDIFDGLYMLFGDYLGQYLFPSWDTNGWWGWSADYWSSWNGIWGWSSWNGIWGWSDWNGLWGWSWDWSDWNGLWGWSSWTWIWQSSWNGIWGVSDWNGLWNWSFWGWSSWNWTWDSSWIWTWDSSWMWIDDADGNWLFSSSSWNWILGSSSWDGNWGWSDWIFSSSKWDGNWGMSSDNSGAPFGSGGSGHSDWDLPESDDVSDGTGASIGAGSPSSTFSPNLPWVDPFDLIPGLSNFTWTNRSRERREVRGAEAGRGGAGEKGREMTHNGKQREYSLVSSLLSRLFSSSDRRSAVHDAEHHDQCNARLHLIEPSETGGERTYSNQEGCGEHVTDIKVADVADELHSRKKRDTSAKLLRLLEKYDREHHPEARRAQDTRIVDEVEDRIVGGEEASPGQWPWMAALMREGSTTPYCGGSLIADRWVMTAAHCVDEGDKRSESCLDNIVVRLGEFDMASDVERVVEYTPEAVYMHAGYNSRTITNDVALIKLPEPVDVRSTPFIQEACLPTSRDFLDTLTDTTAVYVAGWGVTNAKSDRTVDDLRYVRTPIIETEECSKNKAYGSEIRDGMLCAGYMKGGKDACQGDSGGPLMAQADDDKYYLVGIVSWGEGCARENRPGVYTDVSYFIDWVRQVMRDN